jgi:hypothetical protein
MKAQATSTRHRPSGGLPDTEYPFHDRDILVTSCGRICMHRKKINISTVMAGQRIGKKKSMTAFGLSASCTMIWDISTWNRELCKP